MSTSAPDTDVAIGALLRFALHEIRARIYDGVVAAGFDDVGPPHVTLFRWPGPDGRRPTEIAADTGISKQRVNDLLGELDALGYLERRPDPADARARIVRLTPRGKRMQRVASGVHREVEKEWAQAVGKARFQELRAGLAEITELIGRPGR